MSSASAVCCSHFRDAATENAGLCLTAVVAAALGHVQDFSSAHAQYAIHGVAGRSGEIGSVGGMVLGVLATQVLSYIVYHATPKDPVVLGAVILTMLAAGLIAAWIPARHALAVDPMILLREE